MILTFNDYESLSNIDFNSLGEINESHQYADSIASVMDKLTFYVKRNMSLENSSLNESAKRVYSKDIRFNRNERITTVCIFNEMLKQFEENMKDELAIYEAIINHNDLLEEGVEYDIDSLFESLSLDEGLKDKLKDAKDKFKELWNSGKDTVKVAAKDILDGAKEVTVKAVDVAKVKKDDLVTWAKDAKKDFEEKYINLKKLIDDIVKKGIDSVQTFINNLLDVFTSIGDNLVDSVKKLGGLKMDKDEKQAKLEGIDDEELYKNVKEEGEKSFFNNVILRVEAMLSKDKEASAKLMTESYLEESIVDNKFIAWLAGYKSDGTKMSWWKCILIGLCASLIVWVLPKVLVLAGLGGALATFIAALVGVTWNGIGMLKLIYKRNKERKPGEKFFDKKTSIFFALSILSTCFSVATFLKTIGPLMREICNTMGWNCGDDMGKFGEFIYGITKKISPKNAFQEGGIKEWAEEIQNHGGDVRGNDLAASADEAEKLMNNMPGATEANKDAFKDFLDAAKDKIGTSKVYKAWEAFKDNKDLPLTGVFDTSKWGGSGPIKQAMDALKDAGLIPDSAILGTVGSEATQKASEGMYGFANYITGVDKDQMNMIFQKAAEIAGKDASQLQLHFYGAGAISNILVHTETIQGAFDVLTPNVPFLPMVMPFFDKKKWGQYKMRFASSTRGAAAYTVDKVEMIPGEKLTESSPALDTLKKLHSNAWEDFKKNNPDVIEEGKKKDKDNKVEEPQYIVFYINEGEDTKKEDDQPKEDEKKNESVIGIVIDTLTMMAADVCNFNKSVEIRRRPQPYFMKGLLSRLSFRPLENNDNETKDYIRTTLGQTMKTLILQNVLYGAGKKYIDSKVDGKKAEYTLREKVLGTDTKVNTKKAVFELGNFSPDELIKCLTDESKNNKTSYEFLDGEYASKVSIKKDKNGEITSSKAVRDESSIEHLKYYRVSKEDYKKVMDTYKKNKADFDKKGEWKDSKNQIRKTKPIKPTFIKGENSSYYYKRASKKFMSLPENKRKKVYDYIDIRIVPLLKKGELYKTLTSNEKIKKVLYSQEEGNDPKLNKKVLAVLKPFLYRPEKTFAKEDEHKLGELLDKECDIKGEKLGWFANLFKDEEQIHDTFKEMVEIIWDYLSDNRRKVYKKKDYKPNHSLPEEFETLFDNLIEEFFTEEYDEDTEYEYDKLLEKSNQVLSFEDFLIENED